MGQGQEENRREGEGKGRREEREGKQREEGAGWERKGREAQGRKKGERRTRGERRKGAEAKEGKVGKEKVLSGNVTSLAGSFPYDCSGNSKKIRFTTVFCRREKSWKSWGLLQDDFVCLVSRRMTDNLTRT